MFDIITSIERENIMNIRKNSDNNVIHIANEDYTLFVCNHDIEGVKDYFSVETVPYEGNVSFVVRATGIDPVEASVYGAFRELLEDIFTRYLAMGFIHMEMDAEKRSIKTINHNPDYDNLEIELNRETEDIILTITRGATDYHRNNRVFLERDGDLAHGYAEDFDNFFAKLIEVAKRTQEGGLPLHK